MPHILNVKSYADTDRSTVSYNQRYTHALNTRGRIDTVQAPGMRSVKNIYDR